ncbi:glycosyltransferase family 4 protein [Thalassospiraceae bacterium SW-3-3]|nr:glycosyltransferase family 4 protein [Thalassospiraceae bacterium SW-3-3]
MTKRPRIIAMLQLPPPMHGAAAMNERALAALRKTCDVTLLEMRFTNHPRDIAKLTIGKLVKAFYLSLRLLFELWRKPDALYINFAPSGSAFYRDSIYVLMSKQFGIPAILHLHGQGLQAGRENRFAAWLQHRVFTGQTAIILGDALRHELSGIGCQSAIIANCLPEEAFQIAQPLSGNTTPRLLYLSNLFRSKGINDVLAACAILRQRNTDFALDIAGAEGDISVGELERLVDTFDLENHCLYHGPVDAGCRTKLLSKANLFLFPTRYPNEAQPLVVLEAMAAGVPVITSSIGTLGDIVREGETGRICQPGNPEILANRISDAFTQTKETQDMANAAQASCRAHFSKTRFDHDLQQLIGQIVS